MAGVSGRHSYRMTLAESETRFCRCPPDIIFPPFLGRKALPGQEGEGGPSGPHGDRIQTGVWGVSPLPVKEGEGVPSGTHGVRSKGLFIGLLE